MCRTLEHFEVLSEELEKLAEVRMFGAFLPKIWLLVIKDNRKLRSLGQTKQHSSIYFMIMFKILAEFTAVAGMDVVCLSLSDLNV